MAHNVPRIPTARVRQPVSAVVRTVLGTSVTWLPALWAASGCGPVDAAPGGATGGLPAVGGGNTTGGASAGGAGGSGSGGAASGGSSGGASSGGSTTSGGATASGGAAAGGNSSGAGGASAGGQAGSGGNSSGGASSGGAGSGGGSGDGDTLSPGCGTPFQAPPPKNQQQELQIQGDPRYYLMDVPSGADNTEPLMLVFGLHGYDMNNIAVVDLFNFTQRSQGGAITVWPQGEGPHPGTTSHWGDNVLKSTWSGNAKNYEFLRQIMTDLGERYCIDESRVFIAGFSMGAFFTNQIACDHADWFRAFAPVAGGPPSCQSSSVQSAIMVQHGTADTIVEISSGQQSRDFWLAQNGCGDTSAKSLNNCDFYTGCAADKPVAWCTGNYDHYIPSEVASNIWSFFSSFEAR